MHIYIITLHLEILDIHTVYMVYILVYICIYISNYRIGRMNVHGFACYVHERMILEVSNLVHGTSNSGNPSHMKKITTKIEEKPPQLVAIGWSHVYNVLIMLGCGIFLGGMATVTGIATFSIKDWNEERKRIKLIRQRRRRRFIRTE